MGKISRARNLKILSRYYQAGRDKDFLSDDDYSKTLEELESDGYHTFDDLYKHRYVLFIGLCKMLINSMRLSDWDEEEIAKSVWCSTLHHDGTMFDDSFIVGMSFLRVPQASYHLPLSEWERVSKIIPVVDRAPEWDGHTPEDVVKRLEEWIYGDD